MWLHVKKQVFTAALFSALLLTAVVVTFFATLTKAQPDIFDPSDFCEPPRTPSLELHMPTWRSFGSDSVTLSFTLTMSWGDYSVSPIKYYLNGKLQGETFAFKFTPVITPIPTHNVSKTIYFTLTGLSEGINDLEVVAPQISWESGDWVENQLWPYGYASPGYDYPDLTAEFGPISVRDYFTISFPNGYEDTIPPSVTILTTQNKTYDSHEFSLRFKLNEQVSWIGYGLDGGNPITITDEVNQTSFPQGQNQVTIIATVIVRGVADGAHTLTIYATDTAGNTGEPELFHFTIVTDEQTEPEPSSTAILIAITVAVLPTIIVIIALLAYFKRRRR